MTDRISTDTFCNRLAFDMARITVVRPRRSRAPGAVWGFLGGLVAAASLLMAVI